MVECHCDGDVRWRVEVNCSRRLMKIDPKGSRKIRGAVGGRQSRKETVQCSYGAA